MTPVSLCLTSVILRVTAVMLTMILSGTSVSLTRAELELILRCGLHVFLSEGTLVIASPHGKPMLGSWRHDGERLVMVEDSIAYPVDILQLDEKEFRIRSNKPWQPRRDQAGPGGFERGWRS